MRTAVTRLGQTIIPAAVRKRYRIQDGDSLIWIDDGTTIRVVPVVSDPITALRGIGRDEPSMARLLEGRKKDRERDQ